MLTAILIAAGLGLASGIGGTLLIQRRAAPTPAPVVDTTPVVEATGAAVTSGIEAAQAPELAQKQTEREIATSPVQSIYAEAVVVDRCPPLTGALAAYSVAVAASQGAEGSAAVNVEEAQQDVSKVLAAMVTGEVCSSPVVEINPP